jgi:phosphoenolpyruvate-protein phosphotransferase
LPAELHFAFPLRHGMHARPASALQELAAGYRSRVTYANLRTGKEASAGSVLALVATLTRHRDPCAIRVEGEDEAEALGALRRFVEARLPGFEEASPATSLPGEERRPLPRALRAEAARVLRGLPASGGIARASVVVGHALDACIDAHSETAPVGHPLRTCSSDEEHARLGAAFAEVGASVRAKMDRAANGTERAILKAHLAILEDNELLRRIEEGIDAGGRDAPAAVVSAAEQLAEVLHSSGTAYLRERALDLRDLAFQLVRAMGVPSPDERFVIEREAVLVADALTPSQLIALDKAPVAALVLREGGTTSHTVILARARGLPCVSGIGAGAALADGQDVIVDGERGLVVVEPPPEIGRFYTGEAAKLAALRRRAEQLAAEPAVTLDGRTVEVGANVGSLEEAHLAFASGADAIGLFRTELLFIDGDQPPSEDEQGDVFARSARAGAGRAVTIRTLDAGGDKPLPSLRLAVEENPALGLRAVRLYDAHEALIASQLRAILRASACGNLKIMVPMVSSVEQLRAVRAVVARESEALAGRGISHNPQIEVGVMVEVPAAAFLVEELARAADFFSIGTNDLAQYFFAADRGNEAVARFADPLQPAFLRLLAMIVAAAHRCGRRVGVCGELAGEVRAVPLLIGLGCDSLSVVPGQVGAVKAAVRGCEAETCGTLVRAALAAGTAEEVAELLAALAADSNRLPLTATELVALESASRTRDEAIRELVDLLHLGGRTGDPDALEDAIWQREDLHSTAVGFGAAIPHCKAAAVSATSVAVLRSAGGIAWGAGDEVVHLVIFIAVSDRAAGDEHLRMIAALSRRLVDDDFRRALEAAASAAGVVDLIRSALALPGEGGS